MTRPTLAWDRQAAVLLGDRGGAGESSGRRRELRQGWLDRALSVLSIDQVEHEATKNADPH